MTRFEPGDYVRCIETHWPGIRAGQVLRVVDTRHGIIKVPNNRNIYGHNWCGERYFELVQKRKENGNG